MDYFLLDYQETVIFINSILSVKIKNIKRESLNNFSNFNIFTTILKLYLTNKKVIEKKHHLVYN